MLHHAIRRPEQVMGIGANLIARFQYKIIAKSEQLVGPNIAIQLQQPTQPPSCVVERRASFLSRELRPKQLNKVIGPMQSFELHNVTCEKKSRLSKIYPQQRTVKLNRESSEHIELEHGWTFVPGSDI
jgi:hypothetical protein